MTAYDLGSDDGFAYIDLKNVVPAGISAWLTTFFSVVTNARFMTGGSRVGDGRREEWARTEWSAKGQP